MYQVLHQQWVQLAVVILAIQQVALLQHVEEMRVVRLLALLTDVSQMPAMVAFAEGMHVELMLVVVAYAVQMLVMQRTA